MSPDTTAANGSVDLDRLEREYFYLQQEIQNYDSKSLTIKAWSVSVAGAIAGSSAFGANKSALLFAAIVSVMFWFIEASWKTFQNANYARLKAIEAYMRGKTDSIELMQISTSWNRSYHEQKFRRLINLLTWPHVVVPHGAMAAVLLLMYWFLPT